MHSVTDNAGIDECFRVLLGKQSVSLALLTISVETNYSTIELATWRAGERFVELPIAQSLLREAVTEACLKWNCINFLCVSVYWIKAQVIKSRAMVLRALTVMATLIASFPTLMKAKSLCRTRKAWLDLNTEESVA